jgi:hypothetical protein
MSQPLVQPGKEGNMFTKAFDWLKGEPAMVAAIVSAGLAWAATKGFNLSEDQIALVWSAVAIVFGAGVRAKVTPV